MLSLLDQLFFCLFEERSFPGKPLAFWGSARTIFKGGGTIEKDKNKTRPAKKQTVGISGDYLCSTLSADCGLCRQTAIETEKCGLRTAGGGASGSDCRRRSTE